MNKVDYLIKMVATTRDSNVSFRRSSLKLDLSYFQIEVMGKSYITVVICIFARTLKRVVRFFIFNEGLPKIRES